MFSYNFNIYQMGHRHWEGWESRDSTSFNWRKGWGIYPFSFNTPVPWPRLLCMPFFPPIPNFFNPHSLTKKILISFLWEFIILSIIYYYIKKLSLSLSNCDTYHLLDYGTCFLMSNFFLSLTKIVCLLNFFFTFFFLGKESDP